MRFRPTDLLETRSFVLVAEEYEWYEARDGFFIAPAQDQQYLSGYREEDDFKKINPIEKYEEDPLEAPHLELLNLDPHDRESVEKFVENWGLLGVGKKWDEIRGWESSATLADVEVVKRESFGRWEEEREEESIEEGSLIPGEEYFEGIFAPDPALESLAGATPCDRGSFFEVYGEWVEIGKHFDSRMAPDSYRNLDYRPPTFTEAVRDFKDKAQYILRKQNKKNRILRDSFIRDLRPTWIREDDGSIKKEFHGVSLLDYCYFMLYEDFCKDAITQCLECEEPVHNDPHRRGPKKKFCDDSCSLRFHKRKTRHRKSTFSMFLESQKALETWPKNDEGNPEHPYDLIGKMNDSQRKLAEEWARNLRNIQQGGEAPDSSLSKKQSTSGKRWEEDPLLEPFLD